MKNKILTKTCAYLTPLVSGLNVPRCFSFCANKFKLPTFPPTKVRFLWWGKGSLISENRSYWLQSPKKDAKLPSWALSLSLDITEESDLAPFFLRFEPKWKKLSEIKPSLGSVPYWRNRLQFLDYVQKTLAQNPQNWLFSRWQSAGSAHKCCCCSGGMWQRQKPDIAPPFYRGKLQLQPQVSDTNRVVICKS